MRDAVALRRYLQRHIEPGLPRHEFAQPYWHHVLVLPAYRESPSLLERLRSLPGGERRRLVILVLNRPDSDSDPQANTPLRAALERGGFPRAIRGPAAVYCLNPGTDLYLHDMEARGGPTPAVQGVGVARKTGCDLALQWMATGGIIGEWLCNTDADATLPPDYFARLEVASPSSVGAVYPFRHVPGGDDDCDAATALYELRLHHYVLGLEYAGSPYACHTLGSCIAIRASAYAHVHGFPRRAGAEDFYLLNKLAKLGPIARLPGRCIELQSRRSDRVPFGTGPAVNAISAARQPRDAPLFYHPQCFAALRALHAALPALAAAPDRAIAPLLADQGLPPPLAQCAARGLSALGIDAALAHCHRQAASGTQFQRHFHQWFDALRTLKLIHALRDGGWPALSLQALAQLAPRLWPEDADPAGEPEQLRHAIHRHWGWQ